jgi:Calcineurin-like phosphoesterase
MRRLLALAVALLALPALLSSADILLPGRPDSVKFAVIGDSGSGSRKQYETARQLADARDQFPFKLVLMLGDNIYGREKPHDFFMKFEQPYRRLLDSGVEFRAALGNHDTASIQTHYAPFHMDGHRYYTFSSGPVQFFVLDSTRMSAEQSRWLEQELGASTAAWKIAYMHHPIYSSGKKHGSDLQLRAHLEPLFRQYGVEVAFAGHEHFYERIKPQHGVQYFIVGSAGKLREGNIVHGPLHAAGFDDDLSFMLIEVSSDDLEYQVISRTGQTVDHGTVVRGAAR